MIIKNRLPDQTEKVLSKEALRDERHQYDTDESLDICLNCDRADCEGECERIRQRVYTERKSAIEPAVYEYGGETLTRKEWAKKLGVSYSTMLYRLRVYGICDKTFMRGRAPMEPKAHGRRHAELYTHDGKSMTMKEWAKELGISEACINRRIRECLGSGGSIDGSVFMPPKRRPKKKEG